MIDTSSIFKKAKARDRKEEFKKSNATVEQSHDPWYSLGNRVVVSLDGLGGNQASSSHLLQAHQWCAAESLVPLCNELEGNLTALALPFLCVVDDSKRPPGDVVQQPRQTSENEDSAWLKVSKYQSRRHRHDDPHSIERI
jgi:hypothetical protein